jgi:hypothetical protein
MNFRNKLEHLYLVSLFRLVKCVWVMPGAYPKVQHLKVTSLGLSSGLTHKHYGRLGRVARDKH